MPARGQRLDGLCYVAWDIANAIGKIGDATNHTLRLVLNGVEAIPINAPSEVDSSSAPGLYKINLTDSEMDATTITLAGKSSTANVIIVPVQIFTTGVAQIAFSSVSVSSPHIWTDTQLEQWNRDSLGQIAIDVNCIFARECLAIQEGINTYTLPSYVRTVRRVSWRGISLTPLGWFESQNFFLSDVSFGRPNFYAMSPTAPYDIKFLPVPNESFGTNFNPYAPEANQANCIIDFYRVPDEGTYALPSYVARRTRKAYVLSKAFAAEGKGQSIKASQFYLKKYQFLIEQFKRINEGCFVGKRYELSGGALIPQPSVGRPLLPSNFERR